MTQRTSRSINTEELALRVTEELNDFYEDGMISASVMAKKNTFQNLIRAINHADRITARDMNLEGVVVIYVPAETNNIIFSENWRYAKQYLDDIKAQTDLNQVDRTFFLGKDQYLDIVAIRSRYLYVFSSYPSGQERPDSRFRKESVDVYRGREERLQETSLVPFFSDARTDEAKAYFIPSEGRIVLGKKFRSAHFLSFPARIMPGVVDLAELKESDKKAEDWDTYTIKTPHWGLELLVYEALLWLLPLSASNARGLVESERNKQKRSFETTKPGDSNVVIPHFSYG